MNWKGSKKDDVVGEEGYGPRDCAVRVCHLLREEATRSRRVVPLKSPRGFRKIMFRQHNCERTQKFNLFPRKRVLPITSCLKFFRARTDWVQGNQLCCDVV